MIQRLKEKRVEAGLTMREVGERIGKPHTYIHKWESGDRQINPIDLRDVCSALEISFVEFITRLEEELAQNEQAASGGARRRKDKLP